MKSNGNNTILIIATILCLIGMPSFADAPFKSFGADVLVGDIVRDCSPEMCTLAVVPAPLPGRVKTVNRRDVEAAIRKAGLDPAGLRIPGRVRVSRPSKTVSSKEMQVRIEDAVKLVLPEGFVIDELGSMSDMEVPKTGFEVRARWTGDNQFHRRVSIPVDILSEGTKFRSTQVSALLALESEVPVSARALNRGELIFEKDILWKRIRLESAPSNLALTPQDVVGRLVESSMAAGVPFEQRNLKRVPVVKDGERVKLESSFGLVRVSALAVCRQDGAVGERIRVITMSDNRLVWAKITAPGRAMVVR